MLLKFQKAPKKAMKRNLTKISKISALLLCCVILLSALALSAAAEVSAPSVVYVAGNPGLYPVEYYDADSKQYCGLMPYIYGRISEQTGYTFEYINPDNINAQERMAKNDQAELISAHIDGEIDPQYLRHPVSVTVMKTEKEEKTICIAFSEIASEKLIADITTALNNFSDTEKLSFLVSHADSIGSVQKYRMLTYVVSGVLILLTVAVLTILIILYVKKKKRKKGSMINPEYGIGNDKYYIYCFQNLITAKSKALYYVAYVAFDEKSFRQKFGYEESHAVQRYTAEFLSRQTTAVDYLSMIGNEVYTFLYQSANKESANKRISDVIRELDLYLSNIKTEYDGLFNAGVCILEENMDCSAETAFYSANQGYTQAVKDRTPFAFSTKALVDAAHRKESLRKRVIKAISNGEFIIHLQFVTNRSGNLIGAEALSRWQHPHEGLLQPSQYISMINQSDVITRHDFHIFSLVCGLLEEWKKNGRENLYISCNFTRYSLAFPDFSDRIREVTEKYDFNRSSLVIEITEDLLSCDPDVLKKNLEKCKSLGFRIALDDIGSGYSSLSDLYNFPVDIVKIERDIVNLATEMRGRMLLDGLISLSHSMNMKVLCEGIETSEQNDMILKTECDYIQGYYHSHALPLKEAERFLLQYGYTD